MKKTIIIIFAAIILCVAFCIAAVNFTENRNENELTGETGESTDVMNNEASGETETEDQIEADTSNTDLSVDLSASRGYGLSLVEIDKEFFSIKDAYYVRDNAKPTRTVTILDKIVNLKYNETTQFVGRELKDTYLDDNGNTYKFAEDGTFLAYICDSAIDDFSVAPYIDKGISPEITEDEAIALAEKVAEETFGEAFSKVKFEKVSYNLGIYQVNFNQLLGADNSILGLYCCVSILADGRLLSCSMPNLAELRDLDESNYENVTKEDIAEEIAVNASKVFGEKKVDYPLNDIMPICKINGKYTVNAMSATRNGGADIFYEVTD